MIDKFRGNLGQGPQTKINIKDIFSTYIYISYPLNQVKIKKLVPVRIVEMGICFKFFKSIKLS